MTVAYDVQDMTYLRYCVPMACRVARLTQQPQVFIVNRGRSKYNSIGHDAHWNRFQRIVENMSNVTVVESLEECDVLVSVESCALPTRRRRHVAVAHGVDYRTHGRRLAECDAYVCGHTLARVLAGSDLNVAVTPAPVSTYVLSDTLADAEMLYRRDGRRVACVFYPDMHDRHVPDELTRRLARDGYRVYVKQRRKWQDITVEQGDEVVHVYDACWYPSEAMMLPLASDVVVGFGSTAYLDLVEVGVPYVDVDVSTSAGYPRPAAECFRSSPCDLDSVLSAVAELPPRRVCNPCGEGGIDGFVREVVLG